MNVSDFDNEGALHDAYRKGNVERRTYNILVAQFHNERLAEWVAAQPGPVLHPRCKCMACTFVRSEGIQL